MFLEFKQMTASHSCQVSMSVLGLLGSSEATWSWLHLSNRF